MEPDGQQWVAAHQSSFQSSQASNVQAMISMTLIGAPFGPGISGS